MIIRSPIQIAPNAPRPHRDAVRPTSSSTSPRFASPSNAIAPARVTRINHVPGPIDILLRSRPRDRWTAGLVHRPHIDQRDSIPTRPFIPISLFCVVETEITSRAANQQNARSIPSLGLISHSTNDLRLHRIPLRRLHFAARPRTHSRVRRQIDSSRRPCVLPEFLSQRPSSSTLLRSAHSSVRCPEAPPRPPGTADPPNASDFSKSPTCIDAHHQTIILSVCPLISRRTGNGFRGVAQPQCNESENSSDVGIPPRYDRFPSDSVASIDSHRPNSSVLFSLRDLAQ